MSKKTRDKETEGERRQAKLFWGPSASLLRIPGKQFQQQPVGSHSFYPCRRQHTKTKDATMTDRGGTPHGVSHGVPHGVPHGTSRAKATLKNPPVEVTLQPAASYHDGAYRLVSDREARAAHAQDAAQPRVVLPPRERQTTLTLRPPETPAQLYSLTQLVSFNHLWHAHSPDQVLRVVVAPELLRNAEEIAQRRAHMEQGPLGRPGRVPAPRRRGASRRP